MAVWRGSRVPCPSTTAACSSAEVEDLVHPVISAATAAPAATPLRTHIHPDMRAIQTRTSPLARARPGAARPLALPTSPTPPQRCVPLSPAHRVPGYTSGQRTGRLVLQAQKQGPGGSHGNGVGRKEEPPLLTQAEWESGLEPQEKLQLAFGRLQARWEAVEHKKTAIATVTGIVAGLYLSGNVLRTIDRVPLLPDIFVLVGLLWSARFFWRFVLFRAGRDELRADLGLFYEAFRDRVESIGRGDTGSASGLVGGTSLDEDPVIVAGRVIAEQARAKAAQASTVAAQAARGAASSGPAGSERDMPSRVNIQDVEDEEPPAVASTGRGVRGADGTASAGGLPTQGVITPGKSSVETGASKRARGVDESGSE